MSTEKYAVRMAHDVTPSFPEECVLCGKASPKGSVEVVSGDALSSLFSNSHMRSNAIRCTVPVCLGCDKRWLMRRFGQWAILGGTFLVLYVIVQAIVPLVADQPGGFSDRGLNFIVLFVVVMIMLPIYGFVRDWLAVPITLFSYPKFAEYQFRDVAYGERFENLNNLMGNIDDQFAEVEDEEEEP